MLHAQPPAFTRWSETGRATESGFNSQCEAVGRTMCAIVQISVFVLSIACVLAISVALALAQPRAQAATSPDTGSASEGTLPAFDFANWPLLDLIDARTNVAVFFRNGVPAEVRVAGLRRAWRADPAIRDFKGLEENNWDFDNPSSIPGFGDIGPEVDVPTMVAQIFGEPAPLTALALTRLDERTSSFSLANLARRLNFDTVQF